MSQKEVMILITVFFVIIMFFLYFSKYSISKNVPSTNRHDESVSNTKTLLVAGGCFWCVEADLEKLSGVIGAVSGYAGGQSTDPTYKTYQTGGHREVVEVTYDLDKISYEEIMIYALKHMDPTDGEGSFYDRGVAYAPAMYFETKAEKKLLENMLAEINEHGPYDKPLAILVEERPKFYPAEDYHQDYYKGSLSSVKYQYYRRASGRDAFIKQHWGDDTGPNLPWRVVGVEPNKNSISSITNAKPWLTYQKPSLAELEVKLDPLVFKVTQKDGTERAFSSPLDKEYGRGIYVDVLSGEPLFSSRDKFDSGTGWPSFTKPISPTAVTEHEDRKLWVVRIEVRSTIADNHLGHVFTDGPVDRGGLRYCMNGAALRFIPQNEMILNGYIDYLSFL